MLTDLSHSAEVKRGAASTRRCWCGRWVNLPSVQVEGDRARWT
jgi:hypothetical protein